MRYMHILRTKGDFIYNNWNSDSFNEYKEKLKELENKNYVLKKETEDSLNIYKTFIDNYGDTIVVTLQHC